MVKIFNPEERDFTVKIYRRFLETLRDQGFLFVTYSESLNLPNNNFIVLRHDVDKSPLNSLQFARIQSDLCIRGTYYFRIVKESFDESVIKQIHKLGHEIGYHYEDMSVAAGRTGNAGEKDIAECAIESFRENLQRVRGIAPVSTICMHGSPASRWDNRLLWRYYNYRDFGIYGEPYFDTDFTGMLYITDTGRRWDGHKVALRDKAQRSLQIAARKTNNSQENDRFHDWEVKPVKGSLMNMTDESISFQKRYIFKSSQEIISKIEIGSFPRRVLITFHPQRWSDNPVPWVQELLWQNIKNLIKYAIVLR